MHLKVWEQQGRVDRLQDLIPFWRDGVLAARKGKEVAKLGEFLQRLEEEEKTESWRLKNGGWGNDVGEDVWGPTGDQGDVWDAPPAGAGEGWGSVVEEDWASGRGWGSDGGHGWGTTPATNYGWGADGQDETGRGATSATNHGWGDRPDEAGWGNATENLGAAKSRSDDMRTRSEDTSPGTSAAGTWDGQHDKDPVKKPRDSWSFVEEVARQEDASHERRRSMHEFYAVSLSIVFMGLQSL